jgi:hypothetical protein
MAQQVTTAKQLLEKAEEDFDRPTIVVEQSDDLGRHIKEVGGQAEEAVAGRPR